VITDEENPFGGKDADHVLGRRIPVAVAAQALLAGRGSGSSTSSSGGSGGGGGGTPKSGGALTFAVGSDTGSVDPRQVAGNDSIRGRWRCSGSAIALPAGPGP
jgi:peptide/nickel transport system substrate-binding protein